MYEHKDVHITHTERIHTKSKLNTKQYQLIHRHLIFSIPPPFRYHPHYTFTTTIQASTRYTNTLCHAIIMCIPLHTIERTLPLYIYVYINHKQILSACAMRSWISNVDICTWCRAGREAQSHRHIEFSARKLYHSACVLDK